MLFENEIIQSIENVFKSKFTTKTISDETNISYTSLSELRNKKRSLYNTSVEVCCLLYRFAINHKLNQNCILNERRKGAYDAIDIQLYIEKVVVAFNALDLFSLGLMVVKGPEQQLEKNKLVELRLSNNIFIAESKKCYDTYEFGKVFSCNYCKDAPSDFAEFVKLYSKIDKDTIEKVIFDNEIVIYDLKHDKIQGCKSSTDLAGIRLNTYNSKLIITIEKHDLKYYSNKIEVITSILSKQYNKDTKLKTISYIYDYESNSTQKYSNNKDIIFDIDKEDYRIILEYDDFEIWMPYEVVSNVFDTEEMKIFINKLGIKKIESEKLSKINTYKESINLNKD